MRQYNASKLLRFGGRHDFYDHNHNHHFDGRRWYAMVGLVAPRLPLLFLLCLLHRDDDGWKSEKYEDIA